VHELKLLKLRSVSTFTVVHTGGETVITATHVTTEVCCLATYL